MSDNNQNAITTILVLVGLAGFLLWAKFSNAAQALDVDTGVLIQASLALLLIGAAVVFSVVRWQPRLPTLLSATAAGIWLFVALPLLKSHAGRVTSRFTPYPAQPPDPIWWDTNWVYLGVSAALILVCFYFATRD